MFRVRFGSCVVGFGLLLLATGPAACGGGGGGGGGGDADIPGDSQSGFQCGNGVLEGLEECDDGGDNSDTRADACRSNCRLPACGDGVVDANESCDEGPGNSDVVPDACRLSCADPSCGDGVVDVVLGESCDPGAGLPTATCGSSCRVIFCGNGLLEGGEVCDDGNFQPGDGCSPDCLSAEVCGNAIVDAAAGEQCDDGANNSDTAPDACRTNCAFAACGDGVVDPSLNETCDEGVDNSDAPDALCRSNCQPRRCGDGEVDPAFGEVCDDGNLLSGDGCSGDCLSVEGCGNLYVDLANGEICDDGNLRSHDGCTSGCGVELPLWSTYPSAAIIGESAASAYDSGRDRLVLFGGTDANAYFGDTWEYDGVQWYRVAVANAPPARAGAAMAYDANRQRIVLFGGATTTTQADTWEYDGTTWIQRFPTVSPPARAHHQMARDPVTGNVVVLGGILITTLYQDHWEWDGTNWSYVGFFSAGRYYFASANDDVRGRLVIYGGRGASGWRFGDTREFDGTSWQLVNTPTSPGTRMYHSLGYHPTLGVVLYGGTDATNSASTETWAYDGADWQLLAPPQNPGDRHRFAFRYHAGSGALVLVGGLGINSSWPTDTWTFDGTTWADVSHASEPTARRSPGLVYRGSTGTLLLFGGEDDVGLRGDTWEWDGQQWLERIPLTSAPNARKEPAMAYDAARDRVVLFGGGSGLWFGYGGTWEWDGLDWALVAPVGVGPDGRQGAQMVYDPERGVSVLFGGRVSTDDQNDTWEWDGTGWTELTPASAPSPRRGHQMVYDPDRRRIVLFGGTYLGSSLYDDTWEYDGTDWLQVSPPSAPPARQRGTLVADGNLGRIVLFGGLDQVANVLFNDMWMYDGAIWTQVQPPWSPSPRFELAAAFDPIHRRMMIFGGMSHELLSETWSFRFDSISTEEQCTGGGDEDGDSLVDCDDPDCNLSASCLPVERCDDTIDNDGDGLTDCADPSCGGRLCGAGLICSAGECQ